MSSRSGLRGAGSTIKDQRSSEVSGEGARELTTAAVVTISRADVHYFELGGVVTVAGTEYSAGAGESIREAASGSCNSGGGLGDMSPTGVGVSTSVGKLAECLIGNGSGDGKVGIPASNPKGIPVSPVEMGKKKEKKEKAVAAEFEPRSDRSARETQNAEGAAAERNDRSAGNFITTYSGC